MIELNEHQIIDQVADRLVDAYPRVPAETVDKVVREKYERFEGRPVRDFVPLLVERNARSELAAFAA